LVGLETFPLLSPFTFLSGPFQMGDVSFFFSAYGPRSSSTWGKLHAPFFLLFLDQKFFSRLHLAESTRCGGFPDLPLIPPAFLHKCGTTFQGFLCRCHLNHGCSASVHSPPAPPKHFPFSANQTFSPKSSFSPPCHPDRSWALAFPCFRFFLFVRDVQWFLSSSFLLIRQLR